MGKSTQEGGGCMGNVVIESKHVYCLSSSLIELNYLPIQFIIHVGPGDRVLNIVSGIYFQINIMHAHLNRH